MSGASTSDLPARQRRLLLGFACSAAVAIRVIALSRARVTYDVVSWQIAFDILRRGGDLYRETSRYNYSPMWGWLVLALGRMGMMLGMSLARMISLFLLAIDAATALLIWRIAARRGKSSTLACGMGLLFFTNPISVLVSSDLLMFDGLSILFLLGALWAAERQPKSATPVVALLSLSLLAKHITWFHPLLFGRRAREPKLSWPGALAPYFFFCLSFLPFWRSWDGIREHVFGYRGLDEVYGTEPLRFVAWLPRGTTTVLFVLASLVAVWFLRGVEIGRAGLLLFLVVLIFTPGICPYYFLWPVALGALYPGFGYLLYTGVVTAFFIHSPDVLAQEFSHLPGWWGVWWAVVFWLLWELRQLSRSRITGTLPALGGTA